MRRVSNALGSDVRECSGERRADRAARSVEESRAANAPVGAWGEGREEANKGIRKFLFAKLYRHWKVNRMTHKARRVTGELFTTLTESPGLLPAEWQQRMGGEDKAAVHRTVADYVASMTDRYAMEEHRRLTDLSVAG